MWHDPIVEAIHKVREALAAQCQYDVQALGQYFQAQQQAEHREVVTRAPRRVPGTAPSPSPTPGQAERCALQATANSLRSCVASAIGRA
jgi:hypothetical protein